MGQSVTGKNVTVDVSSGSKCHSGRNVGGRNVKASFENVKIIHCLMYLEIQKMCDIAVGWVRQGKCPAHT